MFTCVNCNYEAKTFKLVVGDLYSGRFTYMAKCPKCGSQLVNVTGTIKEDDLRITEEEELSGKQ